MRSHRKTPPVTRRDALCKMGGGFGMLAFAGLVGESLHAAGLMDDRASGADQDGPRKLDHPARAKRVIFL